MTTTTSKTSKTSKTTFGFPTASIPAATLDQLQTIANILGAEEFANFERENSRPVGLWIPMDVFAAVISDEFEFITKGEDALEFIECEDGSVYAEVAPVAPVAPVARRTTDTSLVTVTKNGDVRQYRQTARDVSKVVQDGYRLIASEVVKEVRELTEVEEREAVEGYIE